MCSIEAHLEDLRTVQPSQISRHPPEAADQFNDSIVSGQRLLFANILTVIEV
ncbi:hypothetical protein BDR04DRAFT_1089241 [Suillus decipiens]|nr:hypothetical protein BDR04DRAFT_1089241 [Suillus decipiens]